MTDNTVADALSQRSVEHQAGFVRHLLRSGQAVLDCGCGPGSITCDFAERVKPGMVTGVDINEDHLAIARQTAADRHLGNAVFQVGSVYDLPLTSASFDLVFAHGVFQHLRDPLTALKEILRVLVPGGIVALRSPDWGALLLAPRTRELTAAFDEFLSAYYGQNDAFAGSNGPRLAGQAGFQDVTFTASLEHEKPAGLGPFAASKLDGAAQAESAKRLREWAMNPDALFVQCWGETIAYKR